MKNPETNQSPFEELKLTQLFGSRSEVWKTETNPNYLVKQIYRSLDGTAIRELSREDLMREAKDVQNFVSEVRDSKIMPKIQVVLGISNESQDETIYMITEKIDGPSLRYEMLSNSDKLEIQKIVAYLVDYYKIHYNGTVSKVPEFCKLENYVKGKNLAEDQGEKVYFVDAHPMFDLKPDLLIQKLERFADELKAPAGLFNDSYAVLKSLS